MTGKNTIFDWKDNRYICVARGILSQMDHWTQIYEIFRHAYQKAQFEVLDQVDLDDIEKHLKLYYRVENVTSEHACMAWRDGYLNKQRALNFYSHLRTMELTNGRRKSSTSKERCPCAPCKAAQTKTHCFSKQKVTTCK